MGAADARRFVVGDVGSGAYGLLLWFIPVSSSGGYKAEGLLLLLLSLSFGESHSERTGGEAAAKRGRCREGRKAKVKSRQDALRSNSTAEYDWGIDWGGEAPRSGSKLEGSIEARVFGGVVTTLNLTLLLSPLGPVLLLDGGQRCGGVSEAKVGES